MTDKRRDHHDRSACQACWDEMLAAADAGALSDSARSHLDSCETCQAASRRVLRLAESIGRLKDQAATVADDVKLQGERAAELLIRLARYEAYRKLARRAFSASVGLAACLAIAVGLVWSRHEPKKPTQPTGVQVADATSGRSQAPSVDGRAAGSLESSMATAMPVHEWIELPPKGTSADSSLWWLVLRNGE